MGTNYLAPTWRQPENTNKDKLSNYGIDTAGTSVGIDCGPMSNLFGTNSVTYNTSYSIWIKPEFNYNDTTYQTFFGNFSTGNNALLLYYATDIDAWKFAVGDGSGHNYVASATITSNEELGKGEWQHHCVVFDTENDNAYYYINNQQVNSSTSLNKKIATNANFYIGKKWDLAGGKWAGELSQACIFDYTLSIDQRTYLYNLNNPMAISGAEPIAYWPLGDNSNPVATAGYPNISVGADSVFEIPEGNSYPNTINFGNSGGLDPRYTNKITLGIWFNTTSTAPSGPTGYLIFSRGPVANAANGCYTLMIRNISGGKRFQLWFHDESGTSPNPILGSNSNFDDYNDGKWHQIVITIDGTVPQTLQKMYIDGQLIDTATSPNTGINTTTQDLLLGQRQYTYSTLGSKYSNFCVFNDVLELTGTQSITSLYNNGKPADIINYNNLVGWWKLDQSANWEADSVGEWQIPDELSAYPQSFSFNGVDDQINLGLESDLSLGGASKYSTSLWFKKDSNGTNCFWGYNYGDPSGSGFYLWQSSGAFRVAVGNNSLTTGFGYYNIASNNVPIGEWINIVVVFNGTLASGNDRIKVYQNGELATGTYTSGSNFPATLPNGNGASDRNVYLGQLQLANGSFSYSFDGKMSNVMQWTTDLSLSDATDIYNNGVPLPTASVQASSLKAWYKLDNTAIFYPTQQYWGIPNAASTSNILNFSN